jgi:diguanylate cyclase (GGDEF)-like protein
LDRAGRTHEPLALIFADLDHFKSINDTHGHPAGDHVLKIIARRLKDNLRPMDTIARYGGEEFALILPNSAVTSLARVAERLRQCVAQEPVLLPDGTSLNVTASFGVASSQPWATMSASSLIDCADRHLYLAKSRGRNQVSCEPQSVPAVSVDERTALFQRSQAS